MRDRGTGEPMRAGTRNWLSATSSRPLRRAPPPVKTQPAPRASSTPPLTQIVAQHVEELAGARLEDFADQPLPDHTRLKAGHALQLDFAQLRHRGDDGVAVMALDPLGFLRRDVQADGEVVGEVITANGNNGAVRDGAFEEDDQLRGACADVDQADA